MGQNFNNINALDAFKVPKAVYNAIKNASARTGTDFTYLVEKAAAESSFDTNAKAKTSSATGLFQFIESTWMSMVKQHGDKYGLSNYASKIDANGRVSDSNTRREILNLRKNPEISSYMAAEFANGNHEYLKKHVGGNIGSTELYMAHFLGANGASNFLNAMKKSPNMIAADIFPREARANRNVFYDSKNGTPRSLNQIYAMFDNKFDGKTSAPKSMLAVNVPVQTNTPSRNNNYAVGSDPFARLAAFMVPQIPSTPESALRVSQHLQKDEYYAHMSANNWQSYQKNMYNNLSLTAAQMMLLDDFTA